MIFWFRNIFGYLVFAVASTGSVRWLESTVVNDVLMPNLTTIVVALLAINIQTTAVIAVKLRDLADKHHYAFGRTVNEFRLAIFEQAVLVILSLALSAITKAKVPVVGAVPIEIAAFFITYAALHIFLDTAIGLLTALFPEDEGGK